MAQSAQTTIPPNTNLKGIETYQDEMVSYKLHVLTLVLGISVMKIFMVLWFFNKLDKAFTDKSDSNNPNGRKY